MEVTLTPDGDDTILALRHTGLPPSIAGDHRAGWAQFLPILAAQPAAPGRERHRRPRRSDPVSPGHSTEESAASAWTRDWVPSRPRPCACSAT